MTKALYIHIPFCHDICGYCDFVRVGYHTGLVDKYLIQLRNDLKKIEPPVSSIYIGGGTPSALNLDQLNLLFDSIQHLIRQEIEITIEVNPDSLTLDKAELFVRNKVNRVSLGVQSTHDEMLKRIDRTHTFDDVKQSVEILNRVGLSNYSLDLIYGLPEQTIDELSDDIDEIVKLNPKHISLYSLTIEPNSKFFRQNIQAASPILEAQMYQLIDEKLSKLGYEHYEISNYCLPGYSSKHNLSYWTYQDFIGVGIGAAGKEGDIRYTNHRNINDYICGHRKKDELIELSPSDKQFEHIMMNLRLEEGLDLQQFNRLHQTNLLNTYQPIIDKHQQLQNLIVNDNYLRVTKKGRLVLHDILVDFMDD